MGLPGSLILRQHGQHVRLPLHRGPAGRVERRLLRPYDLVGHRAQLRLEGVLLCQRGQEIRRLAVQIVQVALAPRLGLGGGIERVLSRQQGVRRRSDAGRVLTPRLTGLGQRGQERALVRDDARPGLVRAVGQLQLQVADIGKHRAHLRHCRGIQKTAFSQLVVVALLRAPDGLGLIYALLLQRTRDGLAAVIDGPDIALIPHPERLALDLLRSANRLKHPF